MKVKEIIICTLWCVLVLSLFGINYVTNKIIIGADKVYEIYLGGKVIGYISNEDELYDMINNKQKDIKKEFNVKNVYPPSDFQIIKTNSYTAIIEPVEKVYNQLSELSTFTIEGYSINIKGEDKDITIKVLDKNVFDEAVNTFIMAFIDEDEYNAYMENKQPEIETTGKIIEAMFFNETITIKKDYVGVNEKIFTDSKDLSQFLLFGDNADIKSYTVKSGDTIASISKENKLNPKEFLVANPQYKSEESMLAIGDKVNITLIKPVLSYGYDVHEVADQKDPFDEEVEYDYTKDSSYEVITTAGVNGITRTTTKYRVLNGETLAGARIVASEEITKKINQVTVKGRPNNGGSGSYGPGTGAYVDTGTKWQWPTNTPYVITSYYDYRWGAFHDGIDISGTGCGSPIYAAETGTVYQSGWEPSACIGGGECIIIGHENGYYTEYAHMMLGSRLVFDGQQVQRGQQIGRMGATGNADGCHLHFGVFNGVPWRSGGTLNPLLLWS